MATFIGTGGNDTLLGTEGDDVFHAGSGDDSVEGRGGNDEVNGNGGADWLEGGLGQDTIGGGGGQDRFVFREMGAANADLLTDFSSGWDQVHLDAAAFTEIGAAGQFASGDPRFTANASGTATDASDRIIYNTTTGELFYDADGSGPGAAVLIASLPSGRSFSATDFWVFGEPPSGGGAIEGTEGDDSLVGTAADDTILGFGGDDTIDGLAGADTMDGGAGHDTYFVDDTGDVIVERETEGVDTIHSSVSYTLPAWVNNLTLTGSADIDGTGNAIDNVITGNSGDNVLEGGAGADLLIGGEGNDRLMDSDGQAFDTLDGGLGDDIYEFGFMGSSDGLLAEIRDAGGIDWVFSQHDFILGPGIENLTIGGGNGHRGTGNELDNIIVTTGNEPHQFTIDGGDGNDTLIGGSDSDDMFGGAGNDRIIVQDANFSDNTDSYDGGTGFDFVQIDGDSVDGWIVDLGAGTLVSGDDPAQNSGTLTNIEGVTGSPGSDDQITGNDVANVLEGRGGSDTLDGKAGNDTLSGGEGADRFTFTVAPGAANADEITDFVSAADEIHLDNTAHANLGAAGAFATGDARFAANTTGTAEDSTDRVVYNTSTGELWHDADGSGTGAAQLIATLEGAPTLAAPDIVVFGEGGGSGAITGTEGDDSLTGTAGDDTIEGLGGNDTLDGLAGNDLLRGGDGNDVLRDSDNFDGDVTDTLDGGLGDDTYDLRGDPFRDNNPVLVDAGGIDTVLSHRDYVLPDGIENLELYEGAFGTGNALDNVIVTHTNEPHFYLVDGADGDDTLLGGDDPDTFRFTAGSGNYGADSVDGGHEFDKLDFTGAHSAIVGDMRAGTLSGGGTAGSGAVAFAAIEAIHAGAFDDRLTAHDGAVWLDRFGDEHFEGAWLTGGGGNDTLAGGAAIDSLWGEDGNDLISGAGGNDFLRGGAGSDRFIFDVAPGAANFDVIDDFASGGDTIELDNTAHANLGAAGAFSAGDERFAANSAGTAQDGSDRVIYNTSTGELWHDADGNGAGAAELIATLDGAPGLAATDIVVFGEGGGSGGIVGTEGNDTLTGTEGDDSIAGLGGNDSINALGGNDTLNGGTGIDTLNGGAGNDLYIVGEGDVLSDSGGVDTVQSEVSWTLGTGFENLILTGSAFAGFGNGGANTLTGTDLANRLEAGSGDDTIVAGAGDDLLRGNSGTDWLEGGAGNDDLGGGGGQDSFVFREMGAANADVLSDYAANWDSIHLDLAAFGALGEPGRFTSGDARFTANSTGTAQDASDRIIFNTATGGLLYDADGDGAGAAVLFATLPSGRSVVASDFHAFGTPPSGGGAIEGTEGDDSLVGTEADDTINGFGGNDTIDGRGGADTMDGGAGNDTFFVDSSGDVIVERETEGVDTVHASVSYVLSDWVNNLTLTGTADIDGTGNAIDNVITGNSGDNVLEGGAGADLLIGGEGNDRLIDNDGSFDTLDGGLGDDIYEFGFSALEEPHFTVVDGGGVDLAITDIGSIGGNAFVLPADIENLHLRGSESAIGNALDNVITTETMVFVHRAIDGGDGDDAITGSGDEDFFSFSAGSGNYGNDTVDGGGDVDTMTFFGARSGVVADMRAGTATGGGTGGSGSVAFVNIEVIHGSDFDDHLTAYDGALVIESDGHEEFRGGNLDGRGGNDTLIGGAARNALRGLEGDDRISGRGGNDFLFGGAGSDQYVFDVVPGAANADVIQDFASGEDEIHLDNAVHANLGPAGAFASSDGRFAANSTGSAQDASDRVIYNTSTGELWHDADGSGTGAAELIATLEGAPTLAAADILVFGEGSGGSTIIGTEGNDSLVGTNGDDTIDGLGGSDTLEGLEGDDSLLGGTGDDSVLGGPGNDTIHGGPSGWDTLDGGTGNDHIEGGDAPDWLRGGEGDDTLIGGDDGDGLHGGDGHDRLEGGLWLDHLHGDDGNDVLIGGEADDTLDGGAGTDTLEGGEGGDTYVVTPGDVIVENGTDGRKDTVESDGSWTLGPTVENLILTGTGDWSGIGNNLDNFIGGNDGDNYFFAGSGNDRVFGAGGNDTIDLPAGDTNEFGDDVSGGEGIDLLNFAGYLQSGIVVNLAAESAVGGDTAGAGRARVTDIENVVTDQFNDELRGNDVANVLDGRGGDDTFDGAEGNDTLIGGSGADRFVFTQPPRALHADVVNDFVSGTDLIELKMSVAELGPQGRFASEDPRFYAAADATAGHDADDRVVYNTSTGELFYDPDGSGAQGAELIATLQGAPLLQATDIHNSSAVFQGGDADDHLVGTENPDFMSGGAGNDTLDGGGGDDTLDGGAGNDSLVGGAGSDSFFGGDGNDSLLGWHSDVSVFDSEEVPDTLDGGLGDDEYYVDNEADVLADAGGIDTVRVKDMSWTLAPGFENLVIHNDWSESGFTGIGNELDNFMDATYAGSRLEGLGGDDTLFGASIGTSRLFGGDGNDVLHATGDSDILDGGNGDDVLFAGPAQSLTGGAGADSFVFDGPHLSRAVTDFETGVDRVHLDARAMPELGESGTFAADDARFYAAPGATSGHDADDRVVLDTSTGEMYYDPDGDGTEAAQPIAVFNANPAPTDITVINGSAGPEPITGTEGDDTIAGTADADTMVGLGGHDTYIVNHAGDEVVEEENGGIDTVLASVSHTLDPWVNNLTLTGAAAIDGTGNEINNVLTGNSAVNNLAGGLGDDTYVVGSGDVLSDTGGVDTVVSEVSWTLGTGFENLTLAGTAMTGFGNGLANRIVGNAADNRLEAGSGNDTIVSGAGNDLVRGNGGVDWLEGGEGNDDLGGGGGQDSFVFREAGAANADTVGDFASGWDGIALDGGALSALGATGQFSSGDARFAANGSGTAGDSSDRVVYDTSTGNLYYDADGSGGGAAELIASFQGAPGLAASDITVI